MAALALRSLIRNSALAVLSLAFHKSSLFIFLFQFGFNGGYQFIS